MHVRLKAVLMAAALLGSFGLFTWLWMPAIRLTQPPAALTPLAPERVVLRLQQRQLKRVLGLLLALRPLLALQGLLHLRRGARAHRARLTKRLASGSSRTSLTLLLDSQDVPQAHT